jgi:flagellar hook protein FlgE
MSILKSMNIGLSGLNANGRSMSSIGDNIANVNTVGFKRSRTNFADVMGNTMLGVGDGVSVQNQQAMFEQGALEQTGVSTDLALAGDGFFVLRGQVNGQTADFYTRAGQFSIDNEGFLSSQGGLRLQGYGVDANQNLNTTQGDLRLGGLQSPPNATTAIDLGVNLDSDTEVLAAAWDPTDPAGTSNFATSVTIYDSLGNAIDAEVYYRKTGDNAWEYRVMVDGADQTGGTAGTPSEIATGTLDFNTDGSLATHTPGAANFQPPGATQPQAITYTFDEATQYAGESTLRRLTQDGYEAGDIRDVRIETDGTIVGIFSNGEEQTVGQVAVAKFGSPEGLERIGGNLWSQTASSGEPLVGQAGTGGRGSVVAGALESSNVDLAHEFVKMIAAQRGYQANSRTVTTGDQMLQEVMGLKR